MSKILLLAGMLAMAGLYTACNGPESPKAIPTVASPVDDIATPDAGIEPPLLPGAEAPLQGGTVEIPEIWIVPSQVSKDELASYLMTTSAQLDWVNPGLEDRVAPGTLIAIPASYRVSAGESLSAIAAATGLSEAMLRAINPQLSATRSLPAGTVLSMPQVTVMPAATSLGAAAAALNLSDSDLLSANPALAEIGDISAGTVLVLPPKDGEP